MSYTALLRKLDVTKNNQWKGMNKKPLHGSRLGVFCSLEHKVSLQCPPGFTIFKFIDDFLKNTKCKSHNYMSSVCSYTN